MSEAGTVTWHESAGEWIGSTPTRGFAYLVSPRKHAGRRVRGEWDLWWQASDRDRKIDGGLTLHAAQLRAAAHYRMHALARASRQRNPSKRRNPGERQRAAAAAFAMHRAPPEHREAAVAHFRKWHDLADALDRAKGPAKAPTTANPRARAARRNPTPRLGKAPAGTVVYYTTTAGKTKREAVDRFVGGGPWQTTTIVTVSGHRVPYGEGVLATEKSHPKVNPASYASPLAKRQDIRGAARGAGSFLREARTGGHPYWAFSRWQSSDYTDKQAYAQLERALGAKFMRSATHPRADRGFWDGEIEGAILSKYGSPA